MGWTVVKAFLAADAQMPTHVLLPRPPERQVARSLFERREFTVIEVIEALGVLAQPELLQTQEQDAALVSRREINPEVETGAVVVPIAREVQ